MSQFSLHNRPAVSPGRAAQRGIVLIVALIMLVIISLLATFSMRSATSSEAVSGNVRTTQMAMQAAEVALRFCEDGVEQSFAATPVNPLTALPYQASPRYKNPANWDGSTSVSNNFVTVIATSTLGATSTYKRNPECMIEAMEVVDSSGVLSTTSTFLITARGFGPEVPSADSSRTRPAGSEAWLQSTLEF